MKEASARIKINKLLEGAGPSLRLGLPTTNEVSTSYQAKD